MVRWKSIPKIDVIESSTFRLEKENRCNATLEHVINNTVNKYINSTPSKLLLDYNQHCKEDENLRVLVDKLHDIDQHYCDSERDKA